MKMMNETPVASNQDAFDRAWDRLVNNFHLGRCSDRAFIGDPLKPGHRCAYRKWNDNGEVINACVVGWMLPETVDWKKDYSVGGANMPVIYMPVEDIVRHVEEARLQLQSVNTDLLHQLQGVHDRSGPWESVEKMRESLIFYANLWKLQIPPSLSVCNVEAAKQMTFPNG